MNNTVLLWTIKQVSAALQLSERTIYNLVKSGELRPIHIGSSLRFDPADIDILVAKKKRERDTFAVSNKE